MLLFLLSGLLLRSPGAKRSGLRFAARTLFQLLFHEPPRSTFRPAPTLR
jgi:hypothetical protein